MTELPEVLQSFERQCQELLNQWSSQVLKIRDLRIQARGIAEALAEIGRSQVTGDFATGKLYLDAAMRCAEARRRADFDVVKILLPVCQSFDLNEPSPQESIAAAAAWRGSINRAMAPILEARAQAAAIAKAAAQKIADAELALAEARRQLAEAEQRENAPTSDQARLALRAAEERFAALAKEPAR